MPRYHRIDGRRVQFTAEEEAAKDAEEAFYNSQPEVDKRFNAAADAARQSQYGTHAAGIDWLFDAIEEIDTDNPTLFSSRVKGEIARRAAIRAANPKR